MYNNLKNIIIIQICVFISFLYAEKMKFGSSQIGGYIPHNSNNQRNCISDRERQHIIENMKDIECIINPLNT